MSRHVTPIACAFALAIAAPAHAQTGGFTHEQLAEAARAAVAEAAPDATELRALAGRTEELRLTLAVAQDRLAEHFSRDEQRALTLAFGPPVMDRDQLISWLMRGGHVAVAASDVSGIYNPFADGWLVLRWHQVGGRPRLAQVAVVSGRLVRGGDTGPMSDSATPFAQALVARRLASLSAFMRLPENPGTELFFTTYPTLQVRETESVVAAARTQAGALAQWSRANAHALVQVERAIQRGRDPALLSVPVRVREQLGPIAVVATSTGTELVLQSPAWPARSLFASFVDGASSPQLFALDLAPSPLVQSLGSAAR